MDGRSKYLESISTPYPIGKYVLFKFTSVLFIFNFSKIVNLSRNEVLDVTNFVKFGPRLSIEVRRKEAYLSASC